MNKEIITMTGGIEPVYGIDLTGDVYPSMKGLTIIGNNNKMKSDIMTWGFPMTGSKQLVINARAESVLQKKMFSESVLKRRCIIPAAMFYEWDHDKNRAEFRLQNAGCMLMLGFFNSFNNVNRFVILTTGANESMIKTHDRMPLIIDRGRAADWIFDDDSVSHFLKEESPLLLKHQEYEQYSLDFTNIGPIFGQSCIE